MAKPVKLIFQQFGKLFPELQARIERYSRMDGHTIKAYLRDGRVLIFRYRSDREWSLYTYQAYNN